MIIVQLNVMNATETCLLRGAKLEGGGREGGRKDRRKEKGKKEWGVSTWTVLEITSGAIYSGSSGSRTHTHKHTCVPRERAHLCDSSALRLDIK